MENSNSKFAQNVSKNMHYVQEYYITVTIKTSC